MGTDIHAIAQIRKGHEWVDVPIANWDQRRHYFLFAWLANVRNGFGFAGLPTHDPIQPIATPRGLPEDFVVDKFEMHVTDRANGNGYEDELPNDKIEFFMGNHSHSWLTFDEILEASVTPTCKCGVVPIDYYRTWDGEHAPENYSLDITGHNIRINTPNEITPATTHVRITWKTDGYELDYFVQAIRHLRDKHGEGRLVFGFDS